MISFFFLCSSIPVSSLDADIIMISLFFSLCSSIPVSSLDVDIIMISLFFSLCSSIPVSSLDVDIIMMSLFFLFAAVYLYHLWMLLCFGDLCMSTLAR